MYTEDFSHVYLEPKENLILFIMRFKKKLHRKYVGGYSEHLEDIEFISRNAAPNSHVWDETYSLTHVYRRYCVYKHERMFEGKLPVVISLVALIGAYRNELFSLIRFLVVLWP